MPESASDTQTTTPKIDQPQTDPVEVQTSEPYDGEVVITGISCRLPESANMQEFRDNLMNNVDMITEDNRRWEPGIYGLPLRNGKLKDLTKFDAEFFGVHPKQATYMDPQLRILLEVAYEAIVDAGVNPEQVRGSRTGVFIGTQTAESNHIWLETEHWDTGYILTGSAMTMFSSRLSYFFDFKGPSVTMDTACSASMIALNQALASIRRGDCDAAIVGGSNICLQPVTSLHFMKLGMLSADGMCKTFDENADGYCRSEGIVALYLQKKESAKRIYSTLVHSKTNSDGNKPQGVTFPSGDTQRQLLREVYAEAGINPSEVAYVEAHGTGTQAGDSQEGNAICDVFCKDREEPLLIGSVKSNMGHCESPSGVVAIAKMVIAMEENVLPANLHYKSPNKEIPGLLEGKMQVVSKNTPWNGGLVGINSFGFGGANVHATLRSNEKPKVQRSDGEKPRLFVYGSRSQEGADNVLIFAQKHPHDLDLHQLLNETAHMSLDTHPYRGFTILNGSDTIRNIKKASLTEKRPVWFVFSGMGSQWSGMGKDMMEIEMFRKSIMESDAVLKPFGINLYDNLTSDGEVFNNAVNSFTGIISVQVALVDTLKSMGITPDGIVGHSVGEFSCAYADGCMTAKEAVTAAYWRGQCIKVAELPKGAMAAVGLTWQETKDQCPEGVIPACHNSEDSVTISGDEEAVRRFVDELQEKGVFAKMVASTGIAFHSPAMQKVAPALRRALEQTITSKARTEKWISTSFPESEWSTDTAKFSSADYHVRNVVSPVLFHDALKHVPKNAIVLEIAPHGLLQAILKRSLNRECSVEALMKRGHPHNVEFFLSGLGKSYQAGLDLDPLKLFAPVELPVPRGTPMISPQIRWEHAHTWQVPRPSRAKKDVERGTTFEIDLSKDSEDRFLIGHKIDGRIVYPAAGYIVLAWRAIANREGKSIDEVPVMFEDFSIFRATMMSTEKKNTIEVHLIPGTNEFQILDGKDIVAKGKVSIPERKVMAKFLHIDDDLENEQNGIEGGFQTSDLYREFRLKGFEFGTVFKSIVGLNLDATRAVVRWTENWIPFIDALAQLDITAESMQRLPTGITSLMIDPQLQQEKIIDLEDGGKGIKVIIDQNTGCRTAGGVRLQGLQTTTARRHDKKQPVLESHSFVPFVSSITPDTQEDVKDYTDQCTLQSVKALQVMTNNGISNGFRSILDDHLVAEQKRKQFKDNSQNYSDSNKHSYLGVLQEISGIEPDREFAEKAASSVQSKFQALQSDLLFGNLLQEKYLKPCLDIVAENCLTKNLRIVEIAYQNVTNAIFKMVNSQPALNISYNVATPDPDAFEDVPEKEIIEELLFWKPGDNKSKQLPKAHLVVANNVLRKQHNIQTSLTKFSECLEQGGFVLVNEVTTNYQITAPVDELHSHLNGLSYDDMNERSCSIYSDRPTWKKIFTEAGFEIVYEVNDNLLSTLYLLKKTSTNLLENQTVMTINDSSCDWVGELKTKLSEVQSRPKGENLWLKADGYLSGILGMVNCLRFEHGGDKIRCIFNMDKPTSSFDDKDMAGLVSRDLAMNVYQNGKWGTYRHQGLKPAATVPAEHAYIISATVGDLSSLKWHESRLKYFKESQKGSKSICNIHYASLNFRDIMLATGKLTQDAIPGGLENQECMLGMEFSGMDVNGRRVMGMLPAKALATTVDVEKEGLLPVPEHWSLEEAATVPVVYSTAFYSLVIRGNIRKGNSVLIHSGSGGVGQAAISIALHYGCQVYTTVGSEEKREYLKERFPQLNDGVIFNSRDTTFENGILEATKGRGVDIVLNSLAGDKLQSSVRVLAKNGRFLEIGKFDLAQNTPLGMSVFLKNISFHGILLDSLFETDNTELREICRLVMEGIKAGFVKPLKATVFDKTDVVGAFRYMASGKHIGKILIKMRNDTNPIRVPAIPKTYCHPKKTYIVTGGLGGFGFQLALWLAERGAKSIILTSRSGLKTVYHKARIQHLRDSGVDVIISKRNVCDREETVKLLEETNGRPVGGIFHLAMIIKDGLFTNQTAENFRTVCSPKVQGTVNLDVVTREKCKTSLDWFVVFSSITSGRGNAGQTNYGFANSTMERICEQRRNDGYHGLAIQWGPIADVGVFVETVGTNETVLGGTLPQRITSCMQAMDTFLNQSAPVVSSYVPADKVIGGKKQSGGNLTQSIMSIIGASQADSIDPNKTLGDLGLDSLLGVEVKLTLENDYNLSLSPKEIRESTLNRLQELVDKKAREDQEAGPGAEKQEQLDLELRYFLTPGILEEAIPSQKFLKLNNIDTGTPLFIVHHITGHADILDHIASLVTVPVYGIQRTVDVSADSIETMALHYVKMNDGDIFLVSAYNRDHWYSLDPLQTPNIFDLRKIICLRKNEYLPFTKTTKEIEEFIPDQNFHLAGYSFGAVLAQEMALKIQDRTNRVKAMILLDASKDWCDHLMERLRLDDENIEIRAMRSILELAGMAVKDKKLTFSDELLTKTVSTALEINPDMPPEDIKTACKNGFDTIELLSEYTPLGQYKGDIHLIAADSSLASLEIDPLYGLREFCTGEINVSVVSGRHVSFILDENGLEVSKLINNIVTSSN